MTKNDVVLYAAIGVAVAGVYAYTRSRKQTPEKAAPAQTQAPIASRRPSAITAPVQAAKPVKAKTPSTAKKIATTSVNLAAQFGCSHLNGYQKTLCQQGSGALMSFI